MSRVTEQNKALVKEYFELEMALEPENLTCDGELSHAEVNRRYNKIMASKRAVNAKLGFEPTWEEGEQAWRESRRSLDNKR